TSESPNGEILEGAQNLFNLLEDSLVGEFHFGEEENPFHDAGLANCAIQGNMGNIERSEKGKALVRFVVENRAGQNVSKPGSNSQIHCFTCGKKGYGSFSCPKQSVNLTEMEEHE
ncbi:hypothetical protein Goarm_012923, partial [Gossypium armourianum]|nr:hypothetical protein [Gossypium armourianum]